MVRFTYTLRKSWRIARRDTLAPIFERQQFFNVLCVPMLLFLAFVRGDFVADFLDMGAAFLAVALTLPTWFFVNLVLSPFRVHHEDKQIGAWHNNRFVFHEPKFIKTITIAPSDDKQRVDITFPDMPNKCTIGYKVEYHGGIAKLQIGPSMSTWECIDRNKQSGSFFYKGKTKALLHCPTNSDMTIARIYQTYWEVPAHVKQKVI